MDIQTAVEAGILGLKDPQVLAYTAEQARILLSHDGQAIETVQLVWGARWPEEWHDLCIRLP